MSRWRQPLVSILTPSFNQGTWLPANLQSVAAQTYPLVEHIVMDGGSSDDSPTILRSRSRIGLTWRSEPDRGQSHALNKALGVSQGQIIGWLNSDDAYFDTNVVADVVDAFQRHPEVDVIYGHAVLINSDGLLIQTLWAPPFSRRLLMIHDFILQPSVFLRRDACTAILVDETFDYAMDYELWLRLSLTRRFHRVNRILGVERHQPDRKAFTARGIYRSDLARLHSMYGVHTGLGSAGVRKLIKVATRLLGVSLLARAFAAQLAFEGSRDGIVPLARRQILMTRARMPIGDGVARRRQ